MDTRGAEDIRATEHLPTYAEVVAEDAAARRVALGGRPIPPERVAATCEAVEHPGTWRGWVRGGRKCTCPDTAVAVEHRRLTHAEHERIRLARLREANRRARAARLAAREDPQCPADAHPKSFNGWEHSDRTCICPSTLAAVERRRRTSAAASQRAREAHLAALAGPDEARFARQIDLRRADRTDAEALALGYPVVGTVSKHTRALAIKLMLAANPFLEDADIALRLGGVSRRQVQRYKGALRVKGVITADLNRSLRRPRASGALAA